MVWFLKQIGELVLRTRLKCFKNQTGLSYSFLKKIMILEKIIRLLSEPNRFKN